MRSKRREAIWGWALASPIVLGFLFWQAFPMLASLGIGLTDWNALRPPDFVGFDNFQKILTEDRLFWQSLKVTSIFTAVAVPLQLTVAFSIALVLSGRVRGGRALRAMYFLPSIVPVIATSILWLWIFNPQPYGLLNGALRAVGIPAQGWTTTTNTALPSLILMSLWSTGGLMIIFLAGLQGVPAELYDAVDVDGGSWWHRIRYVTIPMMTPTILFNLVIATIVAMQAFTEAFIMTQGGPNNATLFYVLYLYRKAFLELDFGYASALAWVLFVLLGVVTVLIFRSSRSWVYYEEGSRS
ncbi:MAG: sugar ABC transporter permease [Acidimicrobiia bacterium]|jgi:multiple sugar transport system permease protein